MGPRDQFCSFNSELQLASASLDASRILRLQGVRGNASINIPSLRLLLTQSRRRILSVSLGLSAHTGPPRFFLSARLSWTANHCPHPAPFSGPLALRSHWPGIATFQALKRMRRGMCLNISERLSEDMSKRVSESSPTLAAL